LKRYEIIVREGNDFTFSTDEALEIDDVLVNGDKKYLLNRKADTKSFFAEIVKSDFAVQGKTVYAFDIKPK
jgi:hypothetical protein